MKWNLLFFTALFVVVGCKTTDVTKPDANGRTDSQGSKASYGILGSGSVAHAPSTLDETLSKVPDENIQVANDVWSREDGSNRMEVTVWSGTQAGFGWSFDHTSTGTIELEGAPGFAGSYALSVDVALGNEGKTAMVVFQSQGRVYYNVYHWDGSAFSRKKEAKQLGNLKLVGYELPRIDSDPNQADRVIITWASYKGDATNAPTEEIWALAGYVNGHIINPMKPYPVSGLGGVSAYSECTRPDVSCRNNKGYFSYNFKNKEGIHTLVQQELLWETIAEARPPSTPITALETSDNPFVYTRIAANEAKAGTVEWQVVTNTTVDSIRRIIGYNKMYLSPEIKHLEISNNALIDCQNSHPALAIVQDHILVAWLHESNDCLPDLIDKELLQQRIDISTGQLIDEDDYALINSEQLGDQRSVCISGYFGNGNAYYSFHDELRNEVVTKSSYNTQSALHPVATVEKMDLTATATGNQQMDLIASDVTVSVTLYPNPAHEQLHIDFEGNWAKEASVELYNSTGTVVRSWQLATEATTIDISELEPGSFYVLVSDPLHQVRKSLMVQ